MSSNKTYHWLQDGAPYRIINDISVWEDNDNNQVAILKIYPNVQMIFESGKTLYIGANSDGDAGALQADSVYLRALIVAHNGIKFVL